ncbi:MAG TPA: anthranilate synthase component I family protein [Polyangiaceae bacterium]
MLQNRPVDMPPVVREIRAASDVDALARALRGAPGLAVLRSDPRGALRPEDAATSFLACDPVETSQAWVPAQVEGEAARGWSGRFAAPRWVGLVPYEAMRGIERPRRGRSPDGRAAPIFEKPVWNRYDAVVRVDHATGRVAIEADDLSAADRLAARLARSGEARAFEVMLLPARESEGAHAERIRAALESIAAGDIYQVNLARAIDLELRAGDPLDVFLALYRASPAPYGFFADFGGKAVCAASPELALEVRGDRLRTAPIKGTRPRGQDAGADLALARGLDADPKERAELTMAIDLHRNDLGRVAAIGSVRVPSPPRVLAGRTVWSRVAEVVARREAGASLEAILRAVLPCGSVTGAPKVRAMEIVSQLEPVRRGAYTGAFGYVGRDGALVMAVAIRTLEIGERGRGTYGAGGGIVADSDPEREVEETRWKAAQLAALLEG